MEGQIMILKTILIFLIGLLGYSAKEMAHDLNVELDIFSDADTGGCEIRVYFPVVEE